MNKKKMGLFLKQLRKEKNLTLEELSDVCERDGYLTVSANAISNWEHGESIPDIDKLNFLASFYGVTVDEILNGERSGDIDFNNIYHLHNGYLYSKATCAKKLKMKEAYLLITDEGVDIKKRFKQLMLKHAIGGDSSIELKELVFLLDNYYLITTNESALSFLRNVRDLGIQFTNENELWWEIAKNLKPISYLTLSFSDIADEWYLNDTVVNRFDNLDDWEKDVLLATIQIQAPLFLDGSEDAKSWELKHGKPLDEGKVIKETIKFLINHGACLNYEYMGAETGGFEVKKTIDIVERAYNEIKKPLEIEVGHDQNKTFYYVENTRKNRFLLKCRTTIVEPLLKLNYSVSEIYELFINNKDYPKKEIENRMCSLDTFRNDIDFNSLNVDIFGVESAWNQYVLQEEKEDYFYHDVEAIGKDLKNGVTTNWVMVTKWEGGTTPNTVLYCARQKNNELSYKDFLKNRNIKKTKELMKEIDNLSMKEIKNNYFFKGGDKQ